MAQRATKKKWLEYVKIALTNAIAVEKGEMACIDTATGLLTVGATSTTLIPIGYFEEDGTGDGSALFKVRLFHGVWVHFWDNDSGGTPVVAADLLGPCYILDDRTVTGNATGASVAGRVWAIDSIDGVAVEMQGFNAG